MYLKFVEVPEGCRATLVATRDSVKAYPKRTDRGVFPVEIDGVAGTMLVRGSGNYAAKRDAGVNGWFLFEGVPYWVLFDVKFRPDAKVPVKFTKHDGEAPDAQIVRAPKNPKGEAERRAALSASLKAKFAAPTEVNLVLEETAAAVTE